VARLFTVWAGLWLAGCGVTTQPISDGGADQGAADLGADGAPADLAGADLASAPLPFVASAGGHLTISGQRFRFVGANRYDVASFPPGSGKFYCGNAYTDAQIDQMMSELRSSAGATMLRIAGYQSFTLGATDWTTVDRAIAAARKHGLRLMVVLENEWKDCTQPDPATADGRKGGDWFKTGYLSPLGSYALSYRTYVQTIVGRYQDEPTIAMWQLMNEAESTDGPALLAFTKDMAGLVKSLDSKHLLSLGTIGGGQPGTAGAAFQDLHAVAGIDVVEAHDYGHETTALPAAIAADLQVATQLGKPFFLGEAGIAAPAPMYAFSYADRATYMDAKIGAHWASISDGFLVWSFYDLMADNWQGWDFGPTDPLAAVLKARAAQAP